MKRSLMFSTLAVFGFAFAANQTQSQIVINEILYDPVAVEDSYGEWFELVNMGSADVDINGWAIHCHGGFVHTISNGAPLIVPAGGFLVLGRSANTSLNGNVPVAYAYGDAVPLGGGDALWLKDSFGSLVDSVDYASGFPNPSGASMELFNPSMDNRVGGNWHSALTSWNGGDLGTPGATNSVYSAIKPGDILVTEIMLNPEAVPDADGEWFEVYNTTNVDIDLNGVRFNDNGTQTFTVTGSFIIPSHGFGVFTVNNDPITNGGLDFSNTYDWGTSTAFALGRTDMVVMKNGVLLLDSVSYNRNNGWPDPFGTSIILKGFGDDNGNPVNWTTATVREPAYTGTTGDLGSPGTLGTGQSLSDGTPPDMMFARPVISTMVNVFFSEEVDPTTAQVPTNYFIDNGIGNPQSAVRDASNPSVVQLTVPALSPDIMYMIMVSGIMDMAGNMMSPDSTTFTFTPPAAPGDIIITEIMPNPTAVGDPQGEWFEVYNKTDRDIDMNGWIIKDAGTDLTMVSGTVMVPPKGFAVFTVNSDSGTNGGFAVAYDSCGCPCSSLFDWGTHGQFSLGNADQIILKDGTTVIDSVYYTADFPSVEGKSILLRYFKFTNDVAANWDSASVREPGYMGTTGDLGSPGTLGTGQNTGSPFSPTLTVTSGDPIPASGDTVWLQLRVYNDLNLQPWLDLWGTLVYPSGNTKVVLPVKPSMYRAKGYTTRRYRLIFKASEPPGTYTIHMSAGTLGSYPNDTLFTASVTLTKLGLSNAKANLFADESGIPEKMFLDQNFPNPFNPTTLIRYGLSEDTYVSVKVYNLIGQEVKTLVDEFQTAGYKSVLWDGTTASGQTASSGVYIYRISAGTFVETRRMLLMK